MPLTASPLTRKFVYNGTELPDPNPALDINGVRDVLAQTHPEIANAAIDGPKQNGNVQTYTFVRSVGTKG
jgi:PRTRC genetic system protein C